MHDSPCRGGGADAAAEAPSRHAADGIHHFSWCFPLEVQSFKVETITLESRTKALAAGRRPFRGSTFPRTNLEKKPHLVEREANAKGGRRDFVERLRRNGHMM
jgi:hypothetical protein